MSRAWRQLEYVDAELLRAQGIKIHRVTENPQGGRDIIGRVRLPTGDLLTYAVEVKHRDVVDRPEVQTALVQNAHFPMLMMVTMAVSLDQRAATSAHGSRLRAQGLGLRAQGSGPRAYGSRLWLPTGRNGQRPKGPRRRTSSACIGSRQVRS